MRVLDSVRISNCIRRSIPAGGQCLMTLLRVVAFLLASLFIAIGGGAASAGPWSVTLYGGPATYTIFTQTIAGNAKFDSGMIGIAVDRRLAYLGWGWNLVGEAQLQQFASGSS